MICAFEYVLSTKIFHQITYIMDHIIYITDHNISRHTGFAVVGVCNNSANFYNHAYIHNIDEFYIQKVSFAFLVSMECNE